LKYILERKIQKRTLAIKIITTLIIPASVEFTWSRGVSDKYPIHNKNNRIIVENTRGKTT